MNKNKLRVSFSAPLSEQDTDTQTYGCRATNPDICRNNMLENVCAFVSDDSICHSPSKGWKKQYEKLVAQGETE